MAFRGEHLIIQHIGWEGREGLGGGGGGIKGIIKSNLWGAQIWVSRRLVVPKTLNSV